MAFPESAVKEAWERADGKCECRRPIHGSGGCGKKLIWENRGKEATIGSWEAYRISDSGGDAASNCEILCWTCYTTVY